MWGGAADGVSLAERRGPTPWPAAARDGGVSRRAGTGSGRGGRRQDRRRRVGEAIADRRAGDDRPERPGSGHARATGGSNDGSGAAATRAGRSRDQAGVDRGGERRVGAAAGAGTAAGSGGDSGAPSAAS